MGKQEKAVALAREKRYNELSDLLLSAEEGSDDNPFAEIERKFLVTGFPDAKFKPEIEKFLTQEYLSVNPEIRLRTNRNLRTKEYHVRIEAKGDGSISRMEGGVTIPESSFAGLCGISGKSPIEKEFKGYKTDAGNGMIEVCRLDNGTAYGFSYAEIEFPDEESARNFDPCADPVLKTIFIKDVTDDKRYKIKNYWARTRGLKPEE